MTIESPAASPVTSAATTPEERGLARDEVRLLVSGPSGHVHSRFFDLPRFLEAGDLLVVNRSATIPAALPAFAGTTPFRLHLSTRYGPQLWLAEPRWSTSRPRPVPLPTGEPIEAGGAEAVVLGSFAGIPRLRFVEFLQPWQEAVQRYGKPISYGYLAHEVSLDDYQTVFGDMPGSVEMPSAARPFARRTLAALEQRGVELARVTLHTGVSSLESKDIERGQLYPEKFQVDVKAAAQLNRAFSEDRRIIAVGTTTVRALTSVWDGSAFHEARGMTRVYVQPGRQLPPLAGLLTGFHEPQATHLAMLEAVAGGELLSEGYREALAGDYLWHEFGDVHLLLV